MKQRELKIVPRSAWGARAPKARYTMSPDAPRIWVHHTVAAFHRSPSWKERTFRKYAANYMRQIQNFHMDGRGWYDIAYSFVIFKSWYGKCWVFEGRGWGVVGGHTEGDNSSSHGLAYAGNSEVESVGMWVERTYARLIKRGIRSGHVMKDPGIDGHGNAPGASTACPGKNLKARLAGIRRRVHRI